MIHHYPLSKGSPQNNPNLIVVHSMGEYIDNGDQVYSAVEWLKFLGLSAHVLVHPNGDRTICRNDNQGAYHAKGFNTDSLGIEFLVPGIHNYGTFLGAIKTDWATDEQYQSGAEQLNIWMGAHPITRIERHSDLSPGRKLDPGEGFDFERLIDLAERAF